MICMITESGCNHSSSFIKDFEVNAIPVAFTDFASGSKTDGKPHGKDSISYCFCSYPIGAAATLGDLE